MLLRELVRVSAAAAMSDFSVTVAVFGEAKGLHGIPAFKTIVLDKLRKHKDLATLDDDSVMWIANSCWRTNPC